MACTFAFVASAAVGDDDLSKALSAVRPPCEQSALAIYRSELQRRLPTLPADLRPAVLEKIVHDATCSPDHVIQHYGVRACMPDGTVTRAPVPGKAHYRFQRAEREYQLTFILDEPSGAGGSHPDYGPIKANKQCGDAVMKLDKAFAPESRYYGPSPAFLNRLSLDVSLQMIKADPHPVSAWNKLVAYVVRDQSRASQPRALYALAGRSYAFEVFDPEKARYNLYVFLLEHPSKQGRVVSLRGPASNTREVEEIRRTMALPLLRSISASPT